MGSKEIRFESVDWIPLTQNKTQCQVLVNMEKKKTLVFIKSRDFIDQVSN
jgi:hypothetical protein